MPSTARRVQPIGFTGSRSGTFPIVGATQRRERDLTDEQNERVRTLVRELLKREGMTQVKLAPALGLKQPALSGFLASRQGTSYSTARRAAKLAGVEVEDVLAGRTTTPDPYPARARALAFAADVAHPDAIAFVRDMEPRGANDLDAMGWMRILMFWDEQAKAGRMP